MKSWRSAAAARSDTKSCCAKSATARAAVHVREKNLVILDRTLAPPEQVEILAEALRGQDLESLYLSPAARRLLQDDRG